MSRLLHVIFVLLIAFTSQQMAVARGVMQDAAGRVVLCTGQGVQTVTLDRQGNPMELVHSCPDCALNGLDCAPSGQHGMSHVVHTKAATEGAEKPAHIPVLHRTGFARGPPSLV